MHPSAFQPPFSLAARAVSRRAFLGQAAVAAGAVLAAPGALAQESGTKPKLVVFSKVYQELKLSYADAASLTAEAGLDGIDCPVRPGGEVLPERVAEDLPRYAEALGRHQLQMPYITTAITSPASPHAESILRTAKRLGVQRYRLGFVNRRPELTATKQLAEVKAQLKDLAELNRQIGLGAVLQNHSPSGRTVYLGGDLNELRELAEGFDPAHIGVVFDIGHALIVHGDQWRGHFDRLKARLQVAYIKDARRDGRWVPFGEGDIGKTDYFRCLKQAGYRAPLEIHLEYDWAGPGRIKDRSVLRQALQGSARVTAGWWQSA